jgi:hypothetical protein
MAQKRPYVGEVTGHGTGGYRTLEGPYVTLHGYITEGPDAGRPVTLKMSEADARKWSAGLAAMADLIAKREGRTPESEAELKPVKPSGRLADLLGLTEGESK